MADMHILRGDGSKWTIVMHFDVPVGNNSVGVSWSDAIIGSGVGGITSLPDGDGLDGTIAADEKTAIEAGTVYEHQASFRVESGGTSNADLKAAIQSFYASEETAVINRLKTQLRYFGHTEARV